MGNDRTELQDPFALDTDDESGWRAIAEMSQATDDCGQVGDRGARRLAASDEYGWRNIATAWEERERQETAAELATLRALVQDVIDHWHSDSWALSPFSGIREWQKKALETLGPKAATDAPKAVTSLYAGSDLRFAEVSDTPVWL
jgi:hypothetical protein